MGFLNEIKKLLFVSKAVSKSAANKTVEAGKEKGAELIDSADELLDKAKDKAKEVSGDAVEKAGELYEKAMHKTEGIVDDIWTEAEKMSTKTKGFVEGVTEKFTAKKEPVDDGPVDFEKPLSSDNPVEELGAKVVDNVSEAGKKIKDIAGNLGDKFMDNTKEIREKGAEIAENVGGKVMDVSEKVGEKVLDVAEDVGGKIMDVSEDVGSKILEKGRSFWDKAQAAAGDAQEKAGDLMDKAQEEAAKADFDSALEKAKGLGAKIAEKTTGAKDSLLDGTDSFFDKAKRYADGDYHNEGDVTMTENTSTPKADGRKAKGFDDLDGDGNELIDDAIIDNS